MRVVLIDSDQAATRSEQQDAHRVAAVGIADKQYGHSVVGTGASARLVLFTALMIRKITNAIIRKVTTSFKKLPYAITGNPLSCASASDTGRCPERSMNRFEKSTFPSIMPIGGMMIPSTRDVMIRPKAAPMITATARSRTFPRVMNSLNSFSIERLLCHRASFLWA